MGKKKDKKPWKIKQTDIETIKVVCDILQEEGKEKRAIRQIVINHLFTKPYRF